MESGNGSQNTLECSTNTQLIFTFVKFFLITEVFYVQNYTPVNKATAPNKRRSDYLVHIVTGHIYSDILKIFLI